MEYCTTDWLHLEFDYYNWVTNLQSPKQRGGSLFTIWKRDNTGLPYMKWDARKDNQQRNLPCLPMEVINFCTNNVLEAVTMKELKGFTKHRQMDSATTKKLIFHAHPSFKSDSGQECNVWFDWVYFLLHLPNKRGVYLVDGQWQSCSEVLSMPDTVFSQHWQTNWYVLS